MISSLFGDTVLTGAVPEAGEKYAAAHEKNRLTGFNSEKQPETWFSAAQMGREEARQSFVYTTDGRLWWRNMTGRRRPQAGAEFFRKRADASPVWTIYAGSRGGVTRYMRRYLVWNWHFGGTDRVLLSKNGDALDDRIENIVLGDLLPARAAQFAISAISSPTPDTGTKCPCCGGIAPVLSPNLLARALQLPPQQEVILARVWKGAGKAVTGESIIDEMYADDEDGGPEHETARKYFKTQLSLLRKNLEGSGVSIETAGYQRGFRIVIERQGR